ncbi:hypothetical protein ACFY7C_19430 [Streptomyces sp. NPDC012769]
MHTPYPRADLEAWKRDHPWQWRWIKFRAGPLRTWIWRLTRWDIG